MSDGITRIPYPVGRARVETGPLQFGNDWPGIFIRGKHAFAFHCMIRELLACYTFPDLQTSELEALLNLLATSDLGAAE